MKSLSGNIVDLIGRRIFAGRVEWSGGVIRRIVPEPGKRYARTIAPGFVDAHVHIESSMLPPAEFARLAVVHGTVAAVSDPHEIANVLGAAGVGYMLAEARRTPVKILCGAPSCVPATPFETAGAALAKRLGSRLAAPFMTLSFMGLLVIPDLKLSDRGLFSGAKWAFQPLFGGWSALRAMRRATSPAG